MFAALRTSLRAVPSVGSVRTPLTTSKPLVKAVAKKNASRSFAQQAVLARQSMKMPAAVILTRKDKGKKGRRNDDDEDDDDDDHSSSSKAQAKPTKGGKPAAAAPAQDFDLKKALVSFDSHLKKLTTELSTIKLGKADPQLLANVTFDGEPLISIAQIQVRDPLTLSVSLYDTTLIAKVTKAIQATDPNLTVNTDGKVIFIPIPKPTPEHKRNLVKLASTATEKTKVEIRNTRRDLLNDLKGLNLPKDDNKIAETQIQKAHDDHVKKVDAAFKAKEQELSK